MKVSQLEPWSRIKARAGTVKLGLLFNSVRLLGVLLC